MFRYLLLFSFVMWASAFSSGFKSKTEALNYLNNSNIWVAGMPEYSLDNKTGVLTVKLKTKGDVVLYHINMELMKPTKLLSEATVSIALSCGKQMCIDVQTNKETLPRANAMLIMQSTFDDGDYRDKYLEKGTRMVEALNLLLKFYQ